MAVIHVRLYDGDRVRGSIFDLSRRPIVGVRVMWQLIVVLLIVAGAGLLLVRRGIAQKKAFTVSDDECEADCGCGASKSGRASKES